MLSGVSSNSRVPRRVTQEFLQRGLKIVIIDK